MNQEAIDWINKLNLKEHPEGGYFVETYKSEKFVNLPEYGGPRHACTAIYYLLAGDQFSLFHRIKSDEMWHFYAGGSLSLQIIQGQGNNSKLIEIILGSRIDYKETFQAVIKAGSWFAASLIDHNSYSLVGCTVSPGFDYRDWELGSVEMLSKMYPQHKSVIEKYTR